MCVCVAVKGNGILVHGVFYFSFWFVFFISLAVDVWFVCAPSLFLMHNWLFVITFLGKERKMHEIILAKINPTSMSLSWHDWLSCSCIAQLCAYPDMTSSVVILQIWLPLTFKVMSLSCSHVKTQF